MTSIKTDTMIKGAASAVKSESLAGKVAAPGDKSMSHRSIMFGAMAEGTTQVRGLLEGDDILATVGAMKALGADITREEIDGEGVWTLKGVGAAGLKSPSVHVDCGNAGTGVRLIMGAASAYNIDATFIGDASLTKRPMARVLDPLSEMGVEYESADGKRLPVTIKGKNRKANFLKAIDYTPPHASAQVKSCILLAALGAQGETCLLYTSPSPRDQRGSRMPSSA